MKKTASRRISLLLVLLMMVLLLSGCGTEQDALEEKVTGPVTLRVLIDEECSNAMWNLLRKIQTEFEAAHEKVTIKVEKMSGFNSDEEEKIYTSHLREEIAAGNGPDIYLMSTDGYPNDVVFLDLNQAMRDGSFADLSKFYDADQNLRKSGLQETIMDTGVMEDGRFILPLRYDFPVISVAVDRLAELGLSEDVFEADAAQVMNAVAALNDPDAAASLGFYDNVHFLNLFPEFVDFETGEVLVSRDQLREVISAYVNLRCAQGRTAVTADSRDFVSYTDYVDGWHWTTLDGAMYAQYSLGDVLHETILATAEGLNIRHYPLRAVGGEIVAEVSLFGAVDVNCEYPGLAYSFLRSFLTEEGQWEMALGTNESGSPFSDPAEFAGRGFPVRTEGAVEPLLAATTARLSNLLNAVSVMAPAGSEKAFRGERLTEALQIPLTNKDIPVLGEKIDCARFPMADVEWNLANSLDSAIQRTNYDPGKVDIEGYIDEILSSLTVK